MSDGFTVSDRKQTGRKHEQLLLLDLESHGTLLKEACSTTIKLCLFLFEIDSM